MTNEEAEKIKQRAIKFGLTNPDLEEEKKRQREQRFATAMESNPGNRVVKRMRNE